MSFKWKTGGDQKRMRQDMRKLHRGSDRGVGVRVVRFLSGAVNIGVLVILLLCLFLGFYALWDTHQLYEAADANQYEIYKPTEEDDRSFADFKEANPEVIGWLTVYGTAIDYPIVQAEDNSKYLNLAADGTFSASGSLFLDYRNAPDFSDFNSIVYGHHMAESAMFGDIGNFLDEDYFAKHRCGSLYAGGRLWGIDFFAMIKADTSDGAIYRPGITDAEAQSNYLDHLYSLAAVTRESEVSTEDRIILLSTCTEDVTNGRMLLVGKITDEVMENPYAVDEGAKTGPGADLYSFFKQWNRLPMLFWALLLLAVLLLILWGGNRISERRVKKKRSRAEHKI